MDYRIAEILASIERDYSKACRLAEWAASANLSVSRFQHLFKQEVGVCFLKYLKGERLKKAAALLETSNLRVKEIRVRVGASNDTHFIREFEKHYGTTPSSYRRKVRDRKVRLRSPITSHTTEIGNE